MESISVKITNVTQKEELTNGFIPMVNIDDVQFRLLKHLGDNNNALMSILNSNYLIKKGDKITLEFK